MEAYYQQQLACLIKNIKSPDPAVMEAAGKHWNQIAKPLKGLGRFEEMLIRIAGIQGTAAVSLDRKAVVVFCADNGVVAEGVTQTDSSVTAVVTKNFARGLASVNQMAAVCGAEVLPVDMGVAGTVTEPGVRNCRIGDGTKNLRREMAMTMEQACQGIHEGIALAGELKNAGYDLLAVGEMGIGNTTTAGAIASVMLERSAEEMTGRGAGLSDEGLKRKIQVIRDALALHHPDKHKPVEVLASIGGFDIAGMTGLLLGGAIYRIPVVLDGMISLSAALLAQEICPAAVDYMLPSHQGKEPGCAPAFEKLGLTPVIHGELALGEGTGAVMLFPLLDQAHAVYQSKATFEEIRIDAYQEYE